MGTSARTDGAVGECESNARWSTRPTPPPSCQYTTQSKHRRRAGGGDVDEVEPRVTVSHPIVADEELDAVERAANTPPRASTAAAPGVGMLMRLNLELP